MRWTSRRRRRVLQRTPGCPRPGTTGSPSRPRDSPTRCWLPRTPGSTTNACKPMQGAGQANEPKAWIARCQEIRKISRKNHLDSDADRHLFDCGVASGLQIEEDGAEHANGQTLKKKHVLCGNKWIIHGLRLLAKRGHLEPSRFPPNRTACRTLRRLQ